jgi:hypothetical protein
MKLLVITEAFGKCLVVWERFTAVLVEKLDAVD